MERFEKVINQHGPKPDFSAIASRIDFDKYIKEPKTTVFPFKIAIPVAASLILASVAIPIGLQFGGKNMSGSTPNDAANIDSYAAVASSTVAIQTSIATEVAPGTNEEDPIFVFYDYSFVRSLEESEIGEQIAYDKSTEQLFLSFPYSELYHLKGSDAFHRIAVKTNDSISLYEISNLEVGSAIDMPFEYYASLFGVRSPLRLIISRGDERHEFDQENAMKAMYILFRCESMYQMGLASLSIDDPWSIRLEEEVDYVELAYYESKGLLKLGSSIYDGTNDNKDLDFPSFFRSIME